MLRRTETSKTTIGEADLCRCDANDWFASITGEEAEGASGALVLPHLHFDSEELDKRYPSLKAPPQPDIDDVKYDIFDAVYQKGLAEARPIELSTKTFGRMRG